MNFQQQLKRLMRKALLLFLSLFIYGCAGNQPCNPRLDTDFSSTLICTLNGGFEREVSKTQSILDEAKLSNDILINESSTISIEQSEQEQNLKEAGQALAVLEADLNALDKKMAESKNKNTKLKSNIVSIRRSLKKLKTTKPGSSEERKKLDQLIKRKNNLQKALNQLTQ